MPPKWKKKPTKTKDICDMKIVTAKYNSEINKSRKKKSIHPSEVNTRLFCVNKFS